MFRVVFVFWFLTAPVWAQVSPVAVPPDTLIVVRTDEPSAFTAIPYDLDYLLLPLADGTQALVFCMHDHKRVIITGFANGDVFPVVKTYVYTAADGNDDDDGDDDENDDDDDKPDPDPDPKPEPDDRFKITWAVWIEEQADRTEHREASTVMLDVDARNKLNAQGIRVRVYDDEQKAAEQFRPLIKSPLPVLILTNGKKHAVNPAPKTVAELEALVAKHKAKP